MEYVHHWIGTFPVPVAQRCQMRGCDHMAVGRAAVLLGGHVTASTLCSYHCLGVQRALETRMHLAFERPLIEGARVPAAGNHCHQLRGRLNRLPRGTRGRGGGNYPLTSLS